MRISPLKIVAFLAITCFIQAVVTWSQVQNEWVTLRDDKLGFELSFPSSYLVDNESEKSFMLEPITGSLPRVIDTYAKPKIYGYEKSALMTLRIIELRQVSTAKDFIWFFLGPDNSTETRQQFRVGDFVGVKLTSTAEREHYFSRVIVAKKNKIFYISCSAKNKDKEIYDTFLRSLVLDNKEVFGANAISQLRSVVSLSELKTSPEISALLTLRNRRKVTVTKIPGLQLEDNKVDLEFTRPLIVLRQPPIFVTQPLSKVDETVRMRVTYLATGEIGHIEVTNGASEPLVKAVIEATKKIIFLPAEVNGKPVDLVQTEEHKFRKS